MQSLHCMCYFRNRLPVLSLEARFANGYCSRVGGERLGVGLSYVLALWAMYG